MHTRLTMKTRWRALAITAIALVAAATATGTALATSSTPMSGSAQVDGYISDWGTGISEPPASIVSRWPDGTQWSNSVNAPDYFADMYRAGRPDLGKPVESRLFLRYECSTSTSGTLYALVIAAPGVYIDSSGDQFIKNGINEMLVDSGYSANGTPPDFAWVKRDGALARGWEASVGISTSLYSGGYLHLNVHAQVMDGGSQTSAVKDRDIPLTIPTGTCTPRPRVTTATTFKRTYDWTITKTATPASVTTANTSEPVQYLVSANRTGSTDSLFTITGSVANVSGSFSVMAQPYGGASVSCPVSGSTYTCTLTSKTDGVITVLDSHGDPVASSSYAFGDTPTTTARATATVQDTKGKTDGTWETLTTEPISSGTSFPYTQSVLAPDSGCRDQVNVARVWSDGAEVVRASATVHICRSGPPTATAVPTFSRDYTWSIKKTASITALNTLADSTNVTYTLVVTRTPHDSDYVVTGTITGAVATSISVNKPGSCVLTGGNTAYSCALTTNASGTITINYAGGSITKDYAFGAPTSETNKTATIEDDKSIANDWNQLETNYGGGTITYDRTLVTPAVGCTTWTNVARVMIGATEKARDAASVSICRDNPSQITATPAYVRTYNWTVVKTATPTAITTAQSTYDVAYTVDVTRSAPIDYGFTVSGTLAGVTAPFTVTAAPDGAPDVVCTTDQVAFTYSCVLPGLIDGDVTVQSDSGTLTQAYDITSLSPSVTTRAEVAMVDNKTVADGFAPLLDIVSGSPVSGSDVISGNHTYHYVLPLAVPATGCTTYVNIARAMIAASIIAQDDAAVRVCKSDPPPPPSGASPSLFGTTSPTFTRTNTWSIDKKVLLSDGTWGDLAQIDSGTDQATATYQVIIGKTSADSGGAVAGSVQVANPAATSISVTLAFTTPNCTMPAGLTFTVAATDSVTRAFTCTSVVLAPGSVDVRMTWTGASTGTATYSLPYVFGQPTTIIKPFVTATDTPQGATQPLKIAETYDPLRVTYANTLPVTTQCPTWGPIFRNTARIYEGSATSGTALASDTADAQTCTYGDGNQPTIWLDASASTSFNGGYYWDLEKVFDGAQLSPDGRYVDLAYTLTMQRSNDVFGSNFVVRGEAAFTSLNADTHDRVLGISIPGVAASACVFDETDSRYIDVPDTLQSLQTFSPLYTCVLPRKVNAQVVTALYEGTAQMVSSAPIDVARVPYFFAAPTTYERRSIEVWDQFETSAPQRKALVSTGLRSVSYIDRLPLADLSECDLYVNTATIFAAGTDITRGGAVALDWDQEDVFFCPWTDLEPLTMQVSLTPSYLQSYDWSLSKTGGTPVLNTDGTVTMPYTVNTIRQSGVEGDYAVDGAVTVFNPNPFYVNDVVLRNAFAPLLNCNLIEVTLNFSPYQTRRVPFTCTTGVRTSGTLTSTLRGPGLDPSAAIVDFNFNAASSRNVNGAVTVFDRFGTDAETPLPGGNDITSTSEFTYTRTVPLKAGCVVYPNTARLSSGDGLNKVARTTAQICLQSTGDVLYINEQSNSVTIGKYSKTTSNLNLLSANGLRITKIGPSRARPGQTVSYRVKVTNGTTAAIAGIKLTDVLPTGMRFQGSLPSYGVKRNTRGTWTFSLASGASRTFVIKATLSGAATGRKCNVASVAATGVPTARAISCLTVSGAPKQPNVTG